MNKIARIFLSLLMIIGIVVTTGCQKDPTPKVPIDMTKFPNYVENIESLRYQFDDKERITPFWKGNVIYNETVMLVDEGTGAMGKLLYPAIKILSVRDFSLKKEYQFNTDYTIDGNILKRVEGSSIPYLKKENLQGINVPAPYHKVDSISNVATDFVMMGANVIYTESPLLYGNQLSVSYVYDVRTANLASFAEYDNTTLPKLSAKLANKQNIKIVGIGDSVLEGCSSSGKFQREPFMPDFMQLTKNGLEQRYGIEVTLHNQAVGGKESGWGSNNTQINKILKVKPDVVFIHFGINDCGSQISPNMYFDNIQSIIVSVKDDLPDCEFVFLNAFTPNPFAYDYERMENYWKKVSNFSKESTGIQIIDLWEIGKFIQKTKQYVDVTGNGINHVNDYSARLYVMSILSTLINY